VYAANKGIHIVRTNIEIDDDLMAKALSAGPYKTKKEAVSSGKATSRLTERSRPPMSLKVDWPQAFASVRPWGPWLCAGPARMNEKARPTKRRKSANMLVVDSSAWIDFFQGRAEPSVNTLTGLLGAGETRIVVPDLVLFEVLRGFRHERAWRQARQLLESLDVEETASHALALAAAEHHRQLRAQGLTVRSGVDAWVAAFCIDRDYFLLHRDRDYRALELKRGLRVWHH
jgi:predicted nucleic acid-binding protein